MINVELDPQGRPDEIRSDPAPEVESKNSDPGGPAPDWKKVLFFRAGLDSAKLQDGLDPTCRRMAPSMRAGRMDGNLGRAPERPLSRGKAAAWRGPAGLLSY